MTTCGGILLARAKQMKVRRPAKAESATTVFALAGAVGGLAFGRVAENRYLYGQIRLP